EGALAESAQTLYDGLGADERAAMRALLLALFRPDGTRVRVAQAELVGGAVAAQVLGRLVERRLVTRFTGDEGGAALEVVHEALGRRWPLLHQWLEETRAERELLHDVRYDAERWRKAGKPADLLWRGGRLAAVHELGDRLGDAAEFVTAAEQVQRGQAWTRRGFGGLLALVVAAAVVLTLSYLASNRERDKADKAKAQAVEERQRAEDAKAQVEQALTKNIELREQAEGARTEAMDQKRQADEQRRAAEQERARAQREADNNAELRRQAESSRTEAVAARGVAERAAHQAQLEKAEADRQRDLNRQLAEQAEKQSRESEVQRRYAETAQRLHEMARKRMERIEGEYEALRSEHRELLQRCEPAKKKQGPK
ncbi:MAG TPA: hypothetical protein VL172_21465, partial [Kofleriaceae bacterium]|nr:hypothetical protein [Kofleriaceae bacterium]